MDQVIEALWGICDGLALGVTRGGLVGRAFVDPSIDLVDASQSCAAQVMFT
jgi:hypothetical protein